MTVAAVASERTFYQELPPVAKTQPPKAGVVAKVSRLAPFYFAALAGIACVTFSWLQVPIIFVQTTGSVALFFTVCGIGGRLLSSFKSKDVPAEKNIDPLDLASKKGAEANSLQEIANSKLDQVRNRAAHLLEVMKTEIAATKDSAAPPHVNGKPVEEDEDTMLVRWIGGFLDRVFAVGGAFALSQVPQFMMQYHDQLRGHKRELDLWMEKMKLDAGKNSETAQTYIKFFLDNSEARVKLQGARMQEMLDRHQELTDAVAAMDSSSVVSRPFAFLSHLQKDVVQDAFHSFTPGISMSGETLAYALVGMVMGFGVYYVVSKAVLAVVRKEKPPEKKEQVSNKK